MMNNNQRKILTALASSKEPITSSKLAFSLGISSKTVRRNITVLKSICEEHGVILQTKPSVGNYFEIQDPNGLKKLLENQPNNSIPDTPEERSNYLLQLLLYSKDYIKLGHVADDLFISPSRLSADFKKLKTTLSQFQLTIENKPNYGIRIVGSEKNKRVCMAEQYMRQQATTASMIGNSENGNYSIMVNDVITKVLVSENMRMSDISLQSLAIHLLIAIERIKMNSIISFSNETGVAQQYKSEYPTAVALKVAISETFHIDLPDSEVYYLTQHLSGKKHFELNQDHFEIHVDDRTQYLVNQILRSIFDQTRLDFYDDLDLKMNLLLHMIPFLERVKNKMMIRNPIINDIKSNYNFAYELASIGLSKVCSIIDAKITEDEISYFALHFILALERKREDINPSNILIVCSTGRASSQLLAYQVQKKFGAHINTIKIIEAHLLNHISLDSYDYIFSTVPIQEELSIPVQHINNLLNDTDFKQIASCLQQNTSKFHVRNLMSQGLFFNHIDASTKEEVIHEIIKYLKDKVTLPNNFYDLVIEREEFASTELKNMVAIPHPNKAITDTTFIAVCILKKPILWLNQQVQIIFMISIMPNNKQNLRIFYEGLLEFVNRENSIMSLLQDPSYEHMIQLLEGE